LIAIEQQKNLKAFNSWQVGGNAENYCAPKTVIELEEVYRWAIPQFGLDAISILGGGTNVLVSDQGVPGLVIHLRWLSGVERVEATEGSRLEVVTLAGTAKSELLRSFLKFKVAPALFLAGLPGDVGGGVAMNAGVGEAISPREFVEIVDWIEVVQPEKTVRLYKEQLQWSYRHCEGWGPGVISKVQVSWPIVEEHDIVQRVREANALRLKKQPLEWPSCGSVFVNPPGHKSGQLIEAAGLKGFAIGGAQVSEKHGNFIINTGGATALEMHQVIQHVKDQIYVKSGVQLKTEVVYLGAW
jgi:UDP-N-acetylmuramate dehydrogenase